MKNVTRVLAASSALLISLSSVSAQYGGGGSRGGGGGGSSSISCERPAYTSISPAANSTQEAINNVSFVASAGTKESSLQILVNDIEVDTTVLEKADGSFVVTADIATPITDGAHTVELQGETTARCVRNYAYVAYAGEGGAQTVDEEGERGREITDTTEAAPGAGPNPGHDACGDDAEEDGGHQSGIRFSDDNGHWGEAALNELADKCIIHGYSSNDGGNGSQEVAPNGLLTNAETAKIISKSFGYEYGTPGNKWYDEYINALTAAGVMSGSESPNGVITRGAVVKMIVIALGGNAAGQDGVTRFTDLPASHPYAKYIDWAEQQEIVKGYGGGNTIGANNVLTRAEMALMMMRAL